MTETGHRKLAAIMFTDIVGYTATMARDERQALKILEQTRNVLQPLIKAHAGQWLKEMGDGTLSAFESATEAVNCALEIQRELARTGSFKLRIGIHVGDVLFEGGDVFGDGVNVAARIEPLAQPGGISVSDPVYDAIRNKPEIDAVFLGQKQLKNMNRPVKVFELTGEGLPPPRQGSRPVKERLPVVRAILRRAVWLPAAVAVAGLAGYALIARLPMRGGAITSVAVLPFKNFTGDPEQDYFVEGMHEAIIANLAQIKALTVTSRTSVMRYKDSDKLLPQIARELGVDALVEGSVIQADDSVRITAQLIDARTDQHLWAEEFDRDLRHVLALQSEVAKAIARRIRIALTPAEEAQLAGSPLPVDPAAYGAYLRGRHHWNKRTLDGLNRSMEYFNQAVDIDPTFALGYAGLADAFNMQGSYSYLPPRDVLPRAGAMARRALSLDSTLAEAHAALAAFQFNYEWDWEAAEKTFLHALRLNPGYATAHHWYAQLLIATGRTEESFQAMARAAELDPLDLEIGGGLARKYYFARQYDHAIEQCLKTLELDDRHFFPYIYLGLSYAYKGMFEEAIPALQTALALSGGSALVASGLGYTYGLAGREQDALAILAELNAAADERYIPAVSMAAIHTGLGDLEAAMSWLEKAYSERHHYLIFFRVEPMVDPLRSHPRFVNLLQKMNLD